MAFLHLFLGVAIPHVPFGVLPKNAKKPLLLYFSMFFGIFCFQKPQIWWAPGYFDTERDLVSPVGEDKGRKKRSPPNRFTINNRSTKGLFRQQAGSGWWFGTWTLFFHILGIIIPTDFTFIFFRGVVLLPTRSSVQFSAILIATIENGDFSIVFKLRHDPGLPCWKRFSCGKSTMNVVG